MNPGNAQIVVGGRRIDPDAYRIQTADGWTHVKPRSMAVLEYLARHPGTVCSRREIMDAIWGEAEVSEEVLSQAVRELRSAFDDDARKPAVIETIPRGGYRLIADVEPGIVAPDRWSRKWAGLGLGVLVLGVGIALWIALGGRSADAGQRKLAVLPFEYMGLEKSFDYFTDGLTEELITELNSINPERLDVIARTSVMYFKNKQLPLSEIADRLKVDYVVEGSVRQDDDRLRITAQLIETRDKTHLWAESYDRPLRDVLGLQREIAREIARQARVSLGADENDTRDSIEPDAYRHFLRGRQYLYRFHPHGYQKAREELEAAARIEPDHAPIHGWLAAAFSGLAFSEGSPERRQRLARRATEAAKRALDLSPNLGVAHWVLAWKAFAHDWDWERSETLYKRALKVNPNSWWIHWGYGELLSALGRHQEAIERMRAAHELDPVNPFTNVELAAVYNHAGRFEKALAVLEAALELLPNHQELHDRLTNTYEYMGRFGDAIAARETHTQLTSREYDAEAHRAAYRGEGERAYWQWLLDEPRWRATKLARVRVLVRLGRHDEALSLLEEVVENQQPAAAYIGVYPDLQGLHGDPRFRGLLEKMGLAPNRRE